MDETTLRRVFKEMVQHFDGEQADLRFIGAKLAQQLINIDTAAEWHTIRREVLLARRRIRYAGKQQATVQRKLDRRAYMRIYMKNYRRRGTTSSDVG